MVQPATAIAVVVGTQIWLEIDFSSYAVTAAAIGSGTSGWSGFPAPFVYSGTAPNQELTTTFLLIGYLAAATFGARRDGDHGRSGGCAGEREDHPMRVAGCVAAKRGF